MKFKKMSLILALSSALLVTGCSNDSDSVATFDGGKVTKDDLHTYLVGTYGEESLKSLVTDEIAKLEAEKLKVKVTDEEINEKIKTYEDQYGGSDAFKQYLEYYNLSLENVRKTEKSNLLLEKVLAKRIEIKEDELKSYFEENKSTFDVPEQVRASHILVEKEDEAKDLIAQIKGGSDFAELAKEHSIDTGSASNGGDLDFFSKGVMTKTFEDVAFSLKVGDMTEEPVESEFGYHIIKVTEKNEAKEAKYEDVKEQIKSTLTSQRVQTEYATWVDEMFEKYKVELSLDNKEEKKEK